MCKIHLEGTFEQKGCGGLEHEKSLVNDGTPAESLDLTLINLSLFENSVKEPLRRCFVNRRVVEGWILRDRWSVREPKLSH